MKTPQELIDKIDLIKAGDQNAFAGVYEESYKYLHTCVIHIVKNEDTAQDMLQDTYVEIFKNIGQLKSSEDFLSWAATIANRKCFAYIKKDRDVLVDEQTDDEGGETDFFASVADDESFIPENIFDNREKINIIRGIIDDLSDIQRACVIGFYYNDQKQDEIAEQLGIPVNTVKSHINRAKAKIKDSVSDVEKKQGIKLYSVAPFMLLLFGFEAKAYAAETTIPAMSPAVSDSLSAAKAGGAGEMAADAGVNEAGIGTKAAGTGIKAAGSAMKIKVIIAAIIGAGAIGAVTGIVLHNRASENARTEESVQKDMDVSEGNKVEETKEDIRAEENAEEMISEEAEASAEDAAGGDAEKSADGSAVNAAEETGPAEENGAEETGLVKLGNLQEAGYDNVGRAGGGVIIVKKGGQFGAVDYQLNEIVPCRYERFTAANLKGYFVMFDGSSYLLFDKTGKEIYKTSHPIVATANCFIISPDAPAGEWMWADKLDYYDYDGNLIIETSLGESILVSMVGSHDDGIVLLRNFTEMADENRCLLEVGKLYEDGHITWQSEYDGASSWWSYSNDPNSNAASGAGYIPNTFLSGLNGGYYVTYSPIFEWGMMTMYDADSNEVSDFDIKRIYPDGSYKENGLYSEENNTRGYFYDGAYNYNRGTRMVIICDDRNILFDALNKKVLANYDYINMAEDDLWLVGDGDKWGYIDPDGNEIAMYDDAGEYYNGYAPIIKDGKAYLIDMDQNIVEELGEADGVFTNGEIFAVRKGDSTDLFQMPRINDGEDAVKVSDIPGSSEKDVAKVDVSAPVEKEPESAQPVIQSTNTAGLNIDPYCGYDGWADDYPTIDPDYDPTLEWTEEDWAIARSLRFE